LWVLLLANCRYRCIKDFGDKRIAEATARFGAE
jgi:hypothetical protein